MKKPLYSTTNGTDDVPAAAIFPGCRFHGDRVDTHHGRQSDEPIDGCGSALLRHQPEQTVWSPATQVFLHLSGSTPSANRCSGSKPPLLAGVMDRSIMSCGSSSRNDDVLLCNYSTTGVCSETTPSHLRYTIFTVFALIISLKSRRVRCS